MIDNNKIKVKKYNIENSENDVKSTKYNKGLVLKLIIAFVIIAIAIIFIPHLTQSCDKSKDEIEADELEKPVAESVESNDLKQVEEKQDIKNKLEYIEQYFNANRNTVGYIKIDNTAIDYPVVQTDNNEFYLDHNFDNKQDKRGAIFMDYRCDIEDFGATRNMILYGHRMKDGAMFKDLVKYEDKEYFLNNRKIHFDTLDKAYEWEVFAVFETTTDFYYIDTEFPYDEMWICFLEQCKDKSMYKTNTNFYNDDIILTLSTCTTKDDGRLVVMAKLLQ